MGASAGGLAALQTFLEHTPAASGLAYVVVMRLPPEHESHLAKLLHTSLSVTQVSEDTALEPDHVFVIPPNRNLATIDNHLRLQPLEEKRRERAPIDHFFRALARAGRSARDRCPCCSRARRGTSRLWCSRSTRPTWPAFS